MADKKHPHFSELRADARQTFLKQIGKQGGVIRARALLCGREPVRIKKQVQVILKRVAVFSEKAAAYVGGVGVLIPRRLVDKHTRGMPQRPAEMGGVAAVCQLQELLDRTGVVEVREHMRKLLFHVKLTQGDGGIKALACRHTAAAQKGGNGICRRRIFFPCGKRNGAFRHRFADGIGQGFYHLSTGTARGPAALVVQPAGDPLLGGVFDRVADEVEKFVTKIGGRERGDHPGGAKFGRQGQDVKRAYARFPHPVDARADALTGDGNVPRPGIDRRKAVSPRGKHGGFEHHFLPLVGLFHSFPSLPSCSTRSHSVRVDSGLRSRVILWRILSSRAGS